jgi:outer membrane protein OmpA-like peptidoglycan-associated protein
MTISRYFFISGLFILSSSACAASKQYYCELKHSEIRHQVTINQVTGLGQNRQGFMQIEQTLTDPELNSALLSHSSDLIKTNDCLTYLTDDVTPDSEIRLHFDFNKYRISPLAKKTLAAYSDNLKAQGDSVLVTGHTDSIGSEKYNQSLGLKRALTTAQVILDEGVSRTKVSVETAGELKPVATNKTAEGRALNRRAVVKVIQEQ